VPENKGTKITCPKCGSKYYTLEARRPKCPVCAKNDLIPEGTAAKVNLKIRKGGFNDEAQGWTQGYATEGKNGSVYLNGEFTVIDGAHASKKIYTLIGLKSPKGPYWGNRGRAFISDMLNAANNITHDDLSFNAFEARRINSFRDIDGLEFNAQIGIGTNANGLPKNEIDEVLALEREDTLDDTSENPEELNVGAVPIQQPVNDVTDEVKAGNVAPMWMK
jgi:hypothetical protein